MAKLNKQERLESLAKKAARVVHRTKQLRDRIAVTEREMVSSVASGVEPNELKLRLKDLLRRTRGPAKQERFMLGRLEAAGGTHLLESFAPRPRRRKAKKKQ